MAVAEGVPYPPVTFRHRRGRPQVPYRAMVDAMRLVLFEPDIAQNTGTLLRLGACLGVPIDVIEPCGFVFSDRHFRRAGMDYLERAALTRHRSWAAYGAAQVEQAAPGRLVALMPDGDTPFTRFTFEPDDRLLLGRESTGLPLNVSATAAARLRIPMRIGNRSLNVAVAAAMVLGEALRQTGGFEE